HVGGVSMSGLREEVFSATAMRRLAESKPLSLIQTYSMALSTLLALHGGLYLFENDSRIGRAVSFYDLTVRPVGEEWTVHRAGREKEAVSKMNGAGESTLGFGRRHWGGPDNRLVTVALKIMIGYMEFPVEAVIGGDEFHIIVPDVILPFVDSGVRLSYLSVSVPGEAFQTDAKVVRKQRIDRSVCLPLKCDGIAVPESPTAVREWRSDGSVRFVVKLRGKELVALQKKEKVEVHQHIGEPQTIDVTTAGVTLHSFTLPVEVAVNDIHMRVARSSGSLDITIPASYCSPL
ncbi:hypothetical protein FOZ62_014296, partial [Perkinsus olseni]